MDTTVLDVKLCVANFFPTSREGEVNSENNHYKCIQDMFYGDTDKIKAFKERCDKYDMPNVLTIPTIVNSGIYHPIYIADDKYQS